MIDGKTWLLVAAGFGFAAVALGAFGAHGLDDRLGPYERGIWETATQYLMFHVGALAVTGLINSFSETRGFAIAGIAFTAGNLLFSGSLYALALTHHRWLGAVTPVGGLAYLVGWASLVWIVAKVRWK